MSGACWEVDARLGPEMWGDFARPICQAMHLSPWHVPLLHCQPLCQGTSNLHSLKGFAKATSAAMQAPCLWIHPAYIRIPTQPLCSSGPWTKDSASPSLRFLLESSWEINKTICPAGRGPELEPGWHPCFWWSQLGFCCPGPLSFWVSLILAGPFSAPHWPLKPNHLSSLLPLFLMLSEYGLHPTRQREYSKP